MRPSVLWYRILVNSIDSMPEMIKIYIRENPGKATPVERATFYREEIARSQAGLRVERFVEVIYVFIFTEVGELIIQKRSKEK